jgi:GT2 family glycosyltransferase
MNLVESHIEKIQEADDRKPRVGIIIVNWNHARDTLAAYASLKYSNFENWWLYVVDNASEDDSVKFLNSHLDERFTLILNNINAGFSGGCNIGIKRAISEGKTHIFLLNNDATILSSTINSLVEESLRLEDSAVLGCAVKIHGTEKFQFFGSSTRTDVGHPSWFNEKHSEKLSQNLIETDFVLGAALFAPAKIWQETGYFDEKFYLNYEETDWCYRARKLGFPCYVMPTSVVIHKVGGTVGPMGGPLQIYFICRNELLFALRHATLRQKNNIFIRSITNLIKSAAKDILNFRRIKPATMAHAIALYDFGRGKFGDCPAIIREFALAHVSA